MQTAASGQGPRVIWISGFSASGKTSVGRRVDAELRSRGVPSVFLDGDDLRSIFGNRWAYTREERIDLARVYFRLCSHLSTQGLTVVISAVAMYDDVRRWVKENVPGAVEVYLDVPEDERRERDQATKQIYGKIGSQSAMYDEPKAPDLVVHNHGDVSIEAAADQIVTHVARERYAEDVDHGRTEHWARFYAQAAAPEEPSSFARQVHGKLAQGTSLLEVGCGNGRDASFFASEGFAVLGVDISEAAIALCRERYTLRNLSFLAGDIRAVPDGAGPFGAIYSRFCLHAMTPAEEQVFVDLSHAQLEPGGSLFIECRSINDPLARRGEVISKTERILGHYRRFIVPDELEQRLREAGFALPEFAEEAGVARHGDDDPVVIRVRAERA